MLVADEPTASLDVTIQAQILELLERLCKELELTVLLITHDLGVVAETCDRVVVMYAGEVVEEAETRELFSQPAHPYTRGLLGALPALRYREAQAEETTPRPIAGKAPDPAHLHAQAAHAVGLTLAAVATEQTRLHVLQRVADAQAVLTE